MGLRTYAGLALVVAGGVLVACHGKLPPPALPAPAVAPTPPPSAPPPAPTATPVLDDYSRIKAMDVDAINRTGLLAEIHFDFDKSDLRDGDRKMLAQNAEKLRQFDFLQVKVEGHCDERGTVEYNLALGDRRAKAAYDYLVTLGVPAGRLSTASYGKEAPLCREHTEDCWARNRRAHFTVTGSGR